ncbi:MAG: hypothetical protein JWO05_3423 [Gemmatimonadetes bacterium]|nr:hypothetical protein [Gemmatimonadota bacterium]
MKLLTLARDLRRRKARERGSQFVAEGIRAVEELLRSPLAVEGALVSPTLATSPRGAALRAALHAAGVVVTEVTDAEFGSAAETESPQGVLAVAEIPQRSLPALAKTSVSRIVILDGVQDPGNVGTILRTAAALGATATLALPGTVDLWNAKVVRSAMGALFQHPAFAASWAEIDAFRSGAGLVLWGTDAGGQPLGNAAPDHLALVVGNEGAGISDQARARCQSLVSLPISSTVESLNVAVATGIFLYQLRPSQ